MGKKIERIIVVDDSATVHKVMKRFLEAEGFEVCGFAKNGEDAVALFLEEKPDLAFMDITMPVMDGITALGEIIKHDPEAKVVMLSAMGDDELMEKAYGLGATRFLQKPFDRAKVLETIKAIEEGA